MFTYTSGGYLGNQSSTSAQVDTTFDHTFKYLLSLALLENLLHWKLLPEFLTEQGEACTAVVFAARAASTTVAQKKRKDVQHALNFHYFQLLNYAYSVKNKWTNAHPKELRLITETKTQCMTGFVCASYLWCSNVS